MVPATDWSSRARSKSWRGFNPGQWQSEIDVREFIVANATPYSGGPDFLAPL